MQKYSRVISFFARCVTPFYQVITLCVTSSILIYMSMLILEKFNPLENDPPFNSFTPAIIKEWGVEPVVVDVGLYISSWHRFDILENDFIFDGVLWFQFDPSLVSLETIEKFSFEKGEILAKSPASTRLIDKYLFVEYKVRMRFSTLLIQQFFPFDDHRIAISLVNTYVTPAEVIFQIHKSSFIIAKEIDIPGWVQVDRSAKAGYTENRVDKTDERKVIRYPKVVFTIDFTRSGIRQVLLIFLPMFLIFFISLFWMSFDPGKGGTVIPSLAGGSIASLIAYRFVIQGVSPKVGYFMLSDHFFTIFLTLSFMSFVFALFWVHLEKVTPTMIVIRTLIFFTFHIILIVTWYYLLFAWVK